MRKKHGFTLIEVLVVVAIIGLLVGITMPSFKEARRVARKAVCQKNLQQIGTGIQQYLQTNEDTFFVACMAPWVEAYRTPTAEKPLRPSMPICLKKELFGTEVFECPDDKIPSEETEAALRLCKRYYDYDRYVYPEPSGKEHSGKESQLSYEWQGWGWAPVPGQEANLPFQLNGMKLTFKGIWYEYIDPTSTGDRKMRILIKPEKQEMVRDFAAFHGGKNRDGSTNSLYLDLHVDSY